MKTILLLLWLLITSLSQAQTVICFHGTGAGSGWGRAKSEQGRFVEELRQQGFRVLVAKSRLASWNNTNSSSNPDIKSVLKQLKGYSAPYYLVGHSNGGGFASRFARYSGLPIAAVQYSNASGIEQILRDPAYNVPSLFCYSPEDPVVAFADVEEAIAILEDRDVPVEELDLQPTYEFENVRSQHSFLNTAETTVEWFRLNTP